MVLLNLLLTLLKAKFGKDTNLTMHKQLPENPVDKAMMQIRPKVLTVSIKVAKWASQVG